jgi:methionyl aminopeptidase
MEESNKFPPLEGMIASGSILKELFLMVESIIKPGITTKKIDELAFNFILLNGAKPAFLNYNGFPACCCICVNEEVVHCVPSDRVLEEGDIVSVDCGVIKNSIFTDACRTFPVGKISDKDIKLLEITERALRIGIKAAKPGFRIGNISYAIQYEVEMSGYKVSRHFVGHAIGYGLHIRPDIPNYGSKYKGKIIKSGMCLAIEPVVFDGGWDVVQHSKWHIVSADGCKSAHFEDTVYIDKQGPIVITR